MTTFDLMFLSMTPYGDSLWVLGAIATAGFTLLFIFLRWFVKQSNERVARSEARVEEIDRAHREDKKQIDTLLKETLTVNMEAAQAMREVSNAIREQSALITEVRKRIESQ